MAFKPFVLFIGIFSILLVFFVAPTLYFQYGFQKEISTDDLPNYETAEPAPTPEIYTLPPSPTFPPRAALPDTMNDVEYIVIRNKNPNVEKGIYIGPYVDPKVGVNTDSSLLICSVIVKSNGEFFQNSSAVLSVLFNLNDTSNGLVEYITTSSVYRIQNNLTQKVSNEKKIVHLPQLNTNQNANRFIVESGIVFTNGIQMGLDNENNGNLVIKGSQGTIVYNLAKKNKGFVNYINNSNFEKKPNKFYSWVFDKSYSAGFQTYFPQMTTIVNPELNVIKQINFTNKMSIDCASDSTLDILGDEILLQLTLESNSDILFGALNLNNSSMWSYNYKNKVKKELFFDPVPEIMPESQQTSETRTILIKNSRGYNESILIEICTFSNEQNCNIEQGFISNTSICFRSVLVNSENQITTNPYETSRIYFHLNSTMCGDLVEIQQKNSKYVINFSTLDSTYTPLSSNPFENYNTIPDGGTSIILFDGLYLSNGTSISIDNGNLGNCIISTDTSQIEFNIATGYRNLITSPITTTEMCSSQGGGNFNYCPETKIFYCCNVCTNENVGCSTDSSLQNCACSSLSILKYISKSTTTTRPFTAWTLNSDGTNAISNDVSTIQSPIYTTNYYEIVFDSIPFSNSMSLIADSDGTILIQGSKGKVIFGGTNVILYANNSTYRSWFMTTNNEIKNQIVLPYSMTPSPTTPPTEAPIELCNWFPDNGSKLNEGTSVFGTTFVSGVGAQQPSGTDKTIDDYMYIKSCPAPENYEPSNQFTSQSLQKIKCTTNEENPTIFDANGHLIKGIAFTQGNPTFGTSKSYLTYDEIVTLDTFGIKANVSNCQWTPYQQRSTDSNDPSLWAQCPEGKYCTGLKFNHNCGQDYPFQERISTYCCDMENSNDVSSSGQEYWTDYLNPNSKLECPEGVISGIGCQTHISFPTLQRKTNCKLQCSPGFEKRGFQKEYIGPKYKTNSFPPYVTKWGIPVGTNTVNDATEDQVTSIESSNGLALTNLDFDSTDKFYGKTPQEKVGGGFHYLDGEPDDCAYTGWFLRSSSDNRPTSQMAKCPDGKYCAGMEFTHAQGQDDPTQEYVRLYCCKNSNID